MSKVIVLVLLLLTSFAPISVASSATEINHGQCPSNTDIPVSCRIFKPESGALQGKVNSLTILVYRYESASAASSAFQILTLRGYPTDIAGKQFNGVQLGDEYL